MGKTILYIHQKEGDGGISLVATYDAVPARQKTASYYALNGGWYIAIKVEKGNALQLDQTLRVLLPYLSRKLGVTLPN